MSTLSPIQECRQFIGLARLMTGGSLLALKGTLKEFPSVTIVRKSSKSAKLGAMKLTRTVRPRPGAMSPVSRHGY